MLIAELAALGAALCWVIGGLIKINPIRKIGALAFNRVRMSLVFLMLARVSALTGDLAGISGYNNSNADDFRVN